MNENQACGLIVMDIPDSQSKNSFKNIVESSENYYNILTGSSGRFAYFECNDKLFPYAKPIVTTYTSGSNCKIKINDIFNAEENISLIGEGGTGKTTSLLKIWRELLNSEKIEQYKTVPIYVPLNDANTCKDDKFIAYFCSLHYNFNINTITLPNGYKMLLLLDGFNEITISGNNVAAEVRDIISRKSTTFTRIIITSRYDFTDVYSIEGVNKYFIQPLDKDIIDEYLGDLRSSSSNLPYQLLSTPMMLTLYTNTNIMKKEISKKLYIPFLGNNKKGEILFNFILCQLGKTFQKDYLQNVIVAFFSLFVISPYIGYIMERQGDFFIMKKNYLPTIRDGIKKYTAELLEELLNNSAPDLNNYLTFNIDNEDKIIKQISTFLTDTLSILQTEEDRLSFRHQFFRDFFSALHILNNITVSCVLNETPFTLTERIIPRYIMEFIGDISQEYRKQKHENLIKKIINFARHKKSDEIPLLCNNIVNIQAISNNNNLSYVDYSFLDLSKVSLNSIIFSDKQNKAKFEGAILSSNTFLISGHLGQVRSAVYSKDGKKVLSTGDNTIKEWDVMSGQCIMTFYGHENLVNSAVYSRRGDKILSASNDNTIKEWDVETGQCIATLTGHTGYVTKAIYSPSNLSIFSSSWDGRVLQYIRQEDGKWSSAREVAHHAKNIKSISISNDECFCLTSSGDNTAKEWCIDTGRCVHEYLGHTNMVNSAVYSNDIDNQYILTGSYDSTVRVFDRKTCKQINEFENKTWVRNAIFDDKNSCIIVASHGDCLVKELKFCDITPLPINNTYCGHKKAVTNVSFSDDGNRILSTSEDGTIKEWDRISGQCIKEYTGNIVASTNTVYSNDGLQVLTIEKNTFFVAHRNDGIAYRHFEGCLSEISNVAFAPNGEQILSTSEDGLWEWEINTAEVFKYNCLNDRNFVPKHASYNSIGSQIICLLKAALDKNEIKVYIFNKRECNPINFITLPIEAESIEFDSDITFQTFSSDGIIRKWDCVSGDLIQVVGANIQECNFCKCILLDKTIKKIIKESKVYTNWLYISSLKLDGELILLDGKSLLICTNDSMCFIYIQKLYEAFVNMDMGLYCIKSDNRNNTNENFKEFFSNDEYIIMKIDPYQSFRHDKLSLSSDEINVLLKFFSKINMSYTDESLEAVVIKWILCSLLRKDENSKINSLLYYRRGVVFITQIAAGIFSTNLQLKILDALTESFPNIQFIITSSSNTIAKSNSSSFVYFKAGDGI